MLPELSVTLDWRRDGGHAGLLVSTDNLLTPSIFISEKRGYVFDAVRAELIELEDASPKFRLQTSEKDDGITVRFGATNDNVEVDADLKLLLKACESIVVKPHASNGCKLHGVSAGGRSEVTAYFGELESPYPSAIVLRSTDDAALVFAAVGIETNKSVHFEWAEFTEPNDPHPSFEHVKKLQASNFRDVASTNMIPYFNAAIFHEELRNHPLCR